MRPRWVLPVLVVAAVGLTLSIIGLVVTLRGMRSAPGSSPTKLPVDAAATDLFVPVFVMTSQNGEPRTQAMLDGQVTILDFIFTNCPFACPIMTGAMTEIAEKLKGTNVQFLSVSVDPAHDTPERLREYAAANGIDLSRWTFLTGDQATVDRIVRGSLQFVLQPDESRTIEIAGGQSMANITHPTKLLLVGPDRQVLGLFDPQSDEDLRNLEIRARAAAKQLSK